MSRFANSVKTVLLMSGLMGLLIVVGAQFGRQGMFLGLLFGGLANVIAWFFSDKIAIAAMRGVEVFPDSPGVGAGLWYLVDELRQRAELPMPRVYICATDSPNAFATGRSPRKAAVAVTEGALRLLTEAELRGVLGHELAHVRNRDTLTSCIAATIAGVLSYFAQWGLLFGGGRDRGGNPLFSLVALILAPIAALLIQAMISRSREFVADHDGSLIAASPDGLISALQKLDATARRVPLPTHNPAMNNLFIVEPFSGRSLASMFSTHPSTEKRVAALMRLREQMRT